MNNDAFRKLVNSGSVSKTTKEIAREAVEREFRAKKGRKRGRDDDYLSDDDDYDDDDENGNNNDKKKGKKDGDDKETEAKEAAEAEREEEEKKAKKLKQKYRNRARERREGKLNMDYHESKDISAVDAEMSKYLGGDEAYTHLVKGLDKALAEKVRREEMGGGGEGLGGGGEPSISPNQQQDIDLDQIMEDATAAKAKAARDSDSNVMSVDNCKVKNPSALSNGMLSYIKNVEERKRKQKSGMLSISSTGASSLSSLGVQSSSAGQSILRSTLLFSTIANIQDRKCSWELPKETLMSMAQYERLHGNRISTCTPLDQNLILKINSVFSSLSKKSRKSVSTSTSTSNVDKKSKTVSKTKTDEAAADDTQVSTKKPPKPSEPIEDSDDDIFGGIGDYVPPSASK